MNPIKYAIEFANNIVNKFSDKIIAVILYGSVARGDYTMDSDIDLLVILEDFSIKMAKDIAGEQFKILVKTGVEISAKVYGYNDFNKFKKLKHLLWKKCLEME
ncbi:MAG: nucleotidyltransferase domain-containing protein [Methanosarcinales archaeon]